MSRPWRYCYKEVAPFSALAIVQFTEVGVNILFKEATNEGLSYYVFIFYPFAISTLVLLLPLPFIFRRFSAQLCGYKGIEYSSPSLASAMSNLVPAFIFILAVFFRYLHLHLNAFD